VQRGHNRELCFFAEEDYHCYLHWLGRAPAGEDCALYAYEELMTNHVHLLLARSGGARFCERARPQLHAVR
jgi:putative transposase